MASGLRRISSALGRTERLVDDLLDVSQVIDEGVGLELEDVNLGNVVRDEVHRALAQTAGVDCHLSVSATEPIVGRWDRRRHRQLVVHLLSNAIKYGGDKPIVVTVDRAGEDAVLTIHDEGIGVAPEARAKLFDRFARFGSSRHYGGLGLGLWIVKEIVEAHRGQVAVWSDGPGATFRVVLPTGADHRSVGRSA